jgi:signal transduction histidine kinase
MRDEVFLIVREAVRNALNHGAPAEVVVTLAVTPHELRASVRDDGVGFSTQDDPPAHGLGLPAMRERAELVGGTIAISSGPGGTHVQLVVPLPETPK